MKLFNSKVSPITKQEKVKIIKNKTCCKCGCSTHSTIKYTETDIMCVDCFNELMAKDRRFKIDK